MRAGPRGRFSRKCAVGLAPVSIRDIIVAARYRQTGLWVVGLALGRSMGGLRARPMVANGCGSRGGVLVPDENLQQPEEEAGFRTLPNLPAAVVEGGAKEARCCLSRGSGMFPWKQRRDSPFRTRMKVGVVRTLNCLSMFDRP